MTRSIFKAWLLAACCVVTAMGCVSMPEDTKARALFVDFERIVSTREQTSEWIVHKRELEQALPGALRSVCQAPPAARQELLRWLEGEMSAAGGDARTVFLKNGRDLSAAGDILRLERMRDLLVLANARAEEDCPFWLATSDDFLSVHDNSERFIVMLESSGGAWFTQRASKTVYGGGGEGRLAAAWGVSPALTLALGAEVGGRGGVATNTGDKQEISTNVMVGVPLLVRFHHASYLYDLDVSWVGQFNPQADTFQPGVRVAVGGGVSTPRIRAFMPTAVFMVGYEYYPEVDRDLPPMHIVRLGTRVGVSADFFSGP